VKPEERVNRLTKQADYNARIERLTNEDIETVKGVKSWDAMGITDYIIVTGSSLNFMWGASRCS
jgi:hypothetical protein